MNCGVKICYSITFFNTKYYEYISLLKELSECVSYKIYYSKISK